jgi:DNA repair exonuclease SbcCD ATPase subunit
MFVERIDLRTAPGIPRPLVLSDLSAQLILLVGPNGSGKSTIGRVLRWTLWEGDVHPQVQASIDWRIRADDAARPATIFAGAVRWTDGTPKVPAEASGAWSMNVLALLSENDGDIARVIENALSGGFDLPAARESVAGTGRAPRQAIKAMTEANDKLRSALDNADALDRKATTLGELQEHVDEAAGAHSEKAMAERALALAKARVDRREAEVALATLPNGLEKLRARLDGEIEIKTEELATTESEIKRLEKQTHALRETIKSLEFPATEPTVEVISARGGHVDMLQASESDLKTCRKSLAGAEAKHRRTLEALISEPDVVKTLGHDAIEELERALNKRGVARTMLAAAILLLREFPKPPMTLDLDALRDAARHLRRWLRVPMPAAIEAASRSPIGGTGRPITLIIFAAVLLVATLIIAMVTLIPASMVSAAIVGLLLVSALVVVGVLGRMAARGADPSSSPPAPDEHSQLEASWPTGVADAPESWTVDAVETRLDEIEKAESDARSASLLEQQIRRAKTSETSAQTSQFEAEAAVAAKISEWGISPAFADATLAAQAHRLEAAADAEDKVALAKGERDDVQTQVDEQLAALRLWLSELRPDTSVDSGPDAKAAVDSVSTQLDDLVDARKDLSTAEENATRERKRAEQQRQKLTALWTDAGIVEGDDHALGEGLACLDRWTEYKDRIKLAVQRIEPLEAQLSERPNLLDMTAEDAEQLIEEQETLAGTLADRQAMVSDLKKEIHDAVHGNTIQTLTAQLETAQRTLSDQRDHDACTAVGRTLIDWLDSKVSRDNTPPVLERARARFLEFTEGRYSLEVSGSSFVALDTHDDKRRTLAQLSDGTRIQLLLATRLAFLEQAEGDGPKLPLFLDEVLSTTDPARFEQIGRCVVQLVAEGRQVFYATAREREVAQWGSLCAGLGKPLPLVFDMVAAAERTEWPDDLAVAAAARGKAPDWSGLGAREYAFKLGLSLPGPRESAGAWPLVLLMHDDLDAASKCWNDGLEKVGPFRARHKTRVQLPISDEQATRAEARIDLLEAVLDLRSVGRGEAVAWDVVEASGAVTDARLDDMVECLEKHAQDAVEYVAAVRMIARMNSKKADLLQAHLLAEGTLDERPILGLDDLSEQALKRVSTHVDAGTLRAGDIRPFVEWVHAVLTTSEAESWSAPSVQT